MSEMVEEVQRAIGKALGSGMAKREVAIAAIKAMREPTEAMMKAGDTCDEMWDEFTATPKQAADCDVHWKAMIDEALRENSHA